MSNEFIKHNGGQTPRELELEAALKEIADLTDTSWGGEIKKEDEGKAIIFFDRLKGIILEMPSSSLGRDLYENYMDVINGIAEEAIDNDKVKEYISKVIERRELPLERAMFIHEANHRMGDKIRELETQLKSANEMIDSINQTNQAMGKKLTECKNVLDALLDLKEYKDKLRAKSKSKKEIAYNISDDYGDEIADCVLGDIIKAIDEYESQRSDTYLNAATKAVWDRVRELLGRNNVSSSI